MHEIKTDNLTRNSTANVLFVWLILGKTATDTFEKFFFSVEPVWKSVFWTDIRMFMCMWKIRVEKEQKIRIDTSILFQILFEVTKNYV